MNQAIDIPGIRKVLYESVFVRGYQQRMVTKVYFKDGSGLTFVGSLPKKEARVLAYFQKGMDAGMSIEEASQFAESKSIKR